MANKANNKAFNKLKKLTSAKRMTFARTRIGQSMLGLLTPSQFAELFPRYYQQSLPDVGGFREAISRKSQEKQEKYFDSIDEKLGTTSPQAEERARREGRTPGGGRAGGGGTYQGASIIGKNDKEIAAKAAALARKVGATEEEARFLGALVPQESNGNVRSKNDSAIENSYGLWQINMRAHGTRFGTKEQLFDVYTNARAALTLLRTQGRGAWANTIKTDRFRNALEAAGQGAVNPNLYSMDFSSSTPSSGRGGGTSDAGEGYVASNSGGNFNGQGFLGVGNKFQCVQYARTAGGLGHTSGWTPGPKAMEGNLKPGDWLARFNPDGKYGNQPGYSHVVRLEGYKRDEKGKILGMYVTQQFGHTKVHSAFIPAGGDNPEFDANNYHHIIDQGKPASMNTGDGSNIKVQERKEYFKKNPQAIEPETDVKVQTQPVAAAPSPPPPMPHPAASLGNEAHQQTATVNKPTAGFYNVNPDAFKEASIPEGVKRGYPEMLVRMADPHEFRDGFNKSKEAKEAGAYIDENWKMKVNDPDSPKVKEIIDQYKGKVLTPINDKRSEVETGKQTASLDEDAHFVKAAYKPSGDLQQRRFEDFDREALLSAFRMKETGSFAGKYNSNAKAKGGARGAYQFQDKTWAQDTKRTGIGMQYKKATDAPAHIQDEVFYQKMRMDYEKHGSLRKAIFTHYSGNPAGHMSAKALRNNNNQTAQMYAQGILNHAKDFTAEREKTLAQTKPVGPPPGTIPLDQTRVQEPGATTPKPVVEPPKQSPVEKFAKEFAPGGGAPAAAKPVTPAPTTTPSATPAPTTPTATPAPSTPAPTTLPPKLDTSNPVVGASDGGSFDVGNRDISFYPMDKKDNMAAIDTRTQQPLFTARDSERIDITPAQKVQGNMGPTDNGLRGEFEALRREIGNTLSTAGTPPQQQPKSIQQRPDTRMPETNAALLNQNRDKQWHNDAFARAMARTRLQETGDTLNNHFSGGNTNYG